MQGPCRRCGSQLARGTPPGPPGTHASSQFWYTSFIPVFLHIYHLMAQHSLLRVLCLSGGYSLFTHIFHIQVFSHLSSGVLLSSELSMLYLDLHLYHSTRFAWPCLARGKPLSPQYTFFIPVLAHMFNLSFATNVLFKLSNLNFSLHQWHGTCCAQPACQGQAHWTSQSTCLIPVLTLILS